MVSSWSLLARPPLEVPIACTKPPIAAASERFTSVCAYVEQVLAQTLMPGNIMKDNLPIHKVAGVRGATEQVGASLSFLPPYSPDLNSIENAFAKRKALLHATAERTISDLWDAVATVINPRASRI